MGARKYYLENTVGINAEVLSSVEVLSKVNIQFHAYSEKGTWSQN